jgi:hypothetical protein
MPKTEKMADNHETGQTGGQDIKAEARESIRKEIEKAENSSNPQEEKKNLAKKLVEELKDVVEEAKEVIKDRKEAKVQRRFSIKNEEAKKVLTNVVRVFEAAKQGIVITEKPANRVFLTKLTDELPSPSAEQSATITAYLTPYLLGEREIIVNPPNQSKSQFQQDFEILAEENPELAERVKKVLIEMAKNRDLTNVTVKDIEEMFKSRQLEDVESLSIPPELSANLPLDKKEIRETVEALLSPDNFVKYVKKIHEELIEEKKRHLGELNQKDIEELNIELSHDIEVAITDVVSELYNKADADPSYRRVPFHEVESMGYYQSLQTAYNTLSTRIQLIGRALSERKDFEDLKINFYTRLSEKKEFSKEEGEEGNKKTVVGSYLDYLKQPKPVSLVDFFRQLNLEVAHIRELREFTHNAKIVIRFPSGGQDSPWAQLAGYANKIMTTSDFDTIAFLPHSEVYQDALNIYTSFLQAELAKTDWILDPKLFVAGDDGLNDLERETIKMLKQIYIENKEGKDKKSEYQIYGAFSLAQGVAMAILLTEPETIANADPSFKHSSPEGAYPKVDPTFLGEWLSDTVFTSVLNPFIRGHLRWMSEGPTGGPLGFLPIPDPKLVKGWRMGIWDHNEAIKNIENFHRRFYEGKKRIKEGHLTLFDIRNPGRVGSFATRGGWRWGEAYKGLLYNQEVNELPIIDAWRRLENVGFEPWFHYASANAKDIVKTLRSDQTFFDYIYNRYFTNIYSDKTEFQKIIKNIKEGEESRFVAEIAVRFLSQRLPAKIITEERTRYSEDGKRLWETLREMCEFDGTEGIKKMNQAVKDLILAQTQLRHELSRAMREAEEKGGDIGRIEVDFKLDKDNVNRFLPGISEERIKNVETLLEKFAKYFQPTDDEKNAKVEGRKLKDDSPKSRYEQWIDKIKGGRSTLPFALAPEETDYRYLRMRSTGVTTIKRTLGDVASVDKVLTPAYNKLLSTLHSTAISGKKDLSEIVKLITEVKKTLEGLHGKEYANEIACYFAYLTISYFKKDTFAKPLGGLAGLGQTTSIAAEFTGAGRVWEWDSRDIGRFVFALEQSGALEKSPYELQKTPQYEGIKIFGKQLPTEINVSQWLGEKLGKRNEKGEVIPIKFLGREIKIQLPKVRKKDFNIYSATLKKMAGGEFIHKVWDAINTVIPLALAIILLILIQKAFKEAFSQKK